MNIVIHAEDSLATNETRRRVRVLRDETIRAAQRKHFLLFDVIPMFAFVGSLIVLWITGAAGPTPPYSSRCRS